MKSITILFIILFADFCYSQNSTILLPNCETVASNNTVYSNNFRSLLGEYTWVLKPSIIRTHNQTSLDISFGKQEYHEASGISSLSNYIKGFYMGCEFQMNKNQNVIYVPKIGYDYCGILVGYKANLLYYMIPNNHILVVRPEIGIAMVQIYFGFGYNINITDNTFIGNHVIWTTTLNILQKDFKRRKKVNSTLNL